MTAAPETRVCPRCGAAAETADACGGCGLDLAALGELPTRLEWDARARPAPSIKPLLYPTEPSRLALALFGATLALLVAIVISLVASTADRLVELFIAVTALAALIWLMQQLRQARLLGRSVKVGPDTLPDLQALIHDVRMTLAYHKRVDVYVIDNASSPISMSSYLGTRVIVVEGGLVAEMSSPEGRAQLTFLIGRSLGALRAKHTRLNLIIALLASVDAFKYVSPFLRPWFRATIYSGDQIGMACCSDLGVALLATRRLLVGKELADDLPSGNVLPQACLVQRSFLPRLVQLLATEPHVTNRYANLICFARYHDPVLWERLRAAIPPEQQTAVDRLWARSPYRRKVVSQAGQLLPAA